MVEGRVGDNPIEFQQGAKERAAARRKGDRDRVCGQDASRNTAVVDRRLPVPGAVVLAHRQGVRVGRSCLRGVVCHRGDGVISLGDGNDDEVASVDPRGWV